MESLRPVLIVTIGVTVVLTGKLVRASKPKAFIGAGHLGTFCPVHIKTPDSQTESGLGINHIVVQTV